MNYSEEEIGLAFEYFATEAQRIVSEYMDTYFPTLPKEHIEVNDNGHVYWKLTRVSDLHLRALAAHLH